MSPRAVAILGWSMPSYVTGMSKRWQAPSIFPPGRLSAAVAAAKQLENFEIKTVNVRWLLLYELMPVPCYQTSASYQVPCVVALPTKFFASYRIGEKVGDCSDPCHLVWHGEKVHRLRKRRVAAETPATLCGMVNEF